MCGVFFCLHGPSDASFHKSSFNRRTHRVVCLWNDIFNAKTNTCTSLLGYIIVMQPSGLGGGGEGEDSHIKMTGVLIEPFRGQKRQLWCSASNDPQRELLQ